MASALLLETGDYLLLEDGSSHLLLESSAAGIAVDATSNSGYQAAASSLSWSHTWTKTDGMLSIDIEMLSVNDTVTAMTYGGAACTFIGAKTVAAGTGRVECWRIVGTDVGAPASGANTISVTISGTLACAGTAVSYTGVNQSFPVESFDSASGINVGAADATVTITPIADNCWIHAAVATNDTSVTANQTTRNNVTGAAGSGADEDTGPISPASATAMSYTGVGALAMWAIAAYAIRPLSASGAFLPPQHSQRFDPLPEDYWQWYHQQFRNIQTIENMPDAPGDLLQLRVFVVNTDG